MRIFAIFTQAPVGDKSSYSTNSVVMTRKAKKDTDRTSESECDSGKENRRRTRIPKHRNAVTTRKTTKETKGRRSDRWLLTGVSLIALLTHLCYHKVKKCECYWALSQNYTVYLWVMIFTFTYLPIFWLRQKCLWWSNCLQWLHSL